jgi:hypothetical protein
VVVTGILIPAWIVFTTGADITRGVPRLTTNAVLLIYIYHAIYMLFLKLDTRQTWCAVMVKHVLEITFHSFKWLP